MTCPRCGHEWDTHQDSCSRCGLTGYPNKFSQRQASFGSFETQSSLSFAPPRTTSTPIQLPLSSGDGAIDSLLPGTLLRSGRYSLTERLEQQSWLADIREICWVGRDFRYHGRPVMLYEVIAPEASLPTVKKALQTATHSLITAGNTVSLPKLQDVFNDWERIFFVFDLPRGESLYTFLQHSGNTLSEPRAISLCLQISQILEQFARQVPPLVHGLICPKYIYCSENSFQCILGHFSPLIAGGADQFTKSITGTLDSPYAAPETLQGRRDVRSDLYSLLATAYHAITGVVPSISGDTIPRAQSFNTGISPAFDAILAKGLHPSPSQRYQHPSELQRDLLAIDLSSTRGNISGYLAPSTPASSAPDLAAPGSTSPFPIKFDIPDEERESVLLPLPEALPPMRVGNDLLEATITFAVIVLSLSAITILSHFPL